MSSRSESEKYEICFVSNEQAEGEKENSKKAFDAMASHELDPVWVNKKSCLKINKREQKLFVLDPFEGQVYNHLKSLHCRIVGPLCILSCLHQNETLPKRPHPVYSVSMRGITVTCSNLDKALREDLCIKVQLMGGNFSKDLTKSVTHLVVGEVGSKKYHVAANFGLPIMLPTWIQELWEQGQYCQIHATDSSYEKFKCPVFQGLGITVSQLGNEERVVLKAAIEENGGRYSGALRSRETTHLVLLEPHGDKYNFAKSWKLRCVTVDWLYDSIRRGYCMDENLYPLDGVSVPKRSTPIKEKEGVKLSVDCSAINASVISQLNETSHNDFSVVIKSKMNSSLNEIDEFDISSLPKFGLFLDGCKIYLSGFRGQYLDKLRKIVNFGGGMRFDKYSDSVSHVVCYERNEQLMDCINNSSMKPHVVTFHWLLQCGKFQKVVDESPFTFPELIPLNCDLPDESTPCKDDSKTLNTDLLDTKVDASNKSGTILLNKDVTLASDFTEILKQYATTDNNILKATSNPEVENKIPLDVINPSECNKDQYNVANEVKPSSTVQIFDHPAVVDLVNQPTPVEIVEQSKYTNSIKHPEVVDNDEMMNPDDNDNFDEIEGNSKLFIEKTFQVIGFGSKEVELLANMISLNGGNVLEPFNDIRTDIAIVPLVWGTDRINTFTVVTNCWLQKCIEENTLLPFDDNTLFKPFNIAATKKPLQNIVISISQYAGTERDCLMHLSEVLGACCQEYFVRKANPSRNLLPNTHLVASAPEGSKYEASKKWKIPAVTKDWLLAAAKLDMIPPVGNFLVELEPCATAVEVIEKSCGPIHQAYLDESDSRLNFEKLSVQKSNCPAPIINADYNNVVESKVSGCIEDKSDDCDVFIAPNNRVVELIDDDKKCSPKRSEINSSNKFRDSDRQTPKFTISDLLADLDSSPDDFNGKIAKRNPSLPLQEALSYNIKMALRTVGYKESISPLDSNKSYAKNAEEVKSSILENVILCVSKKLNDLKSNLKTIVLALGGQFRWSYDRNCTHFVFQGKGNDFSKDFREAKRHCMKIVSPDWVYACQETQSHVHEDYYPHTYKSRLSLMEQFSTSKASTSETEHFPSCGNDDCFSPKAADDVYDFETPKYAENVNELQESKCAENIRDMEELKSAEKLPDVSKDLDELIVAARSAKAGKRRCRIRTNSSSNSPIDKGKGMCGVSPAYSNIYANCDFKNVVHNIDAVSTEPSQSVPITWDDPTGRIERAKIAAANQGIKNNFPSIDTESTISTLPNSSHSENPEAGAFSSIFTDMANQPIAQSVEKSSSIKKFMLTSFSETEKEKLSSIILELGGQISDIKAFDPSATHLIMGHPLKNLKFLASVASGKWVLHQSYLNDSVDSKCFLPEEAYEWGSEFTQSFIKNPSATILKISVCARRWRLKLAGDKNLTGAFHDWKVVIVADNTDKLNSYMNILEAGGAEIFPLSSVASEGIQPTHAFVEIGSNSNHSDHLKLLVTRQVKCIKPEYLAYYLIEDSPPSEGFYVPAQVKELSELSCKDSAKRTLLNSEQKIRKKSRLNI